jgi:hypothetical protein
MVRRHTLAGSAAFAVLACACCHTGAPGSAFPTGADALDRMKATYACANGIEGEGKIDHVSPEARVRGDVQIFALNSARVRVDVHSSFGAHIYALTSDGTNFKMLDNNEKKFLHGPAKTCNLARMTRVKVPGHALVWLLRGEAPLLVHEREAPTIVWQDGHYIVDIPSTRNAQQQLFLEVYDEDLDKPWKEQRVRVTRVETKQRGVTLYTAELSDHEMTKSGSLAEAEEDDDDDVDDEPPPPPTGGPCNVEVPRSIKISVPSASDDVLFEYKKVVFNPPIPTGAFTQEMPGGVRKIFVDCPDE